MFHSREPAMVATAQLGLITAGLANAFHAGLENALAKADARRERRAAQRYADDLEVARGRADDLGRIAIRAVHDLAHAEAEITRLRAALEQRQAYIDRLNARKAGA